MKAFLQKHRRKIKWILLSALASVLVLVWLAYIASIHAAQIFNREWPNSISLTGPLRWDG